MSTYTPVEAAKKALSLAWDGNLPVDPEVIASQLVVFFPEKDNPLKSKEIPIKFRSRNTIELDGASGQASLINSGDSYYFLCEYNADEISYRNRFTMAHELGHVLLSHVTEEKPKKRDTNFSASTYDNDEIAANSFAAALIMPEEMVRNLFPAARSIQQLAEAFGVSTVAMSYRLRNLGLVR